MVFLQKTELLVLIEANHTFYVSVWGGILLTDDQIKLNSGFVGLLRMCEVTT